MPLHPVTMNCKFCGRKIMWLANGGKRPYNLDETPHECEDYIAASGDTTVMLTQAVRDLTEAIRDLIDEQRSKRS